MARRIGEVYVTVIGDTRGLARQIENDIEGVDVSDSAKRAGEKYNRGFRNEVRKIELDDILADAAKKVAAKWAATSKEIGRDLREGIGDLRVDERMQADIDRIATQFQSLWREVGDDAATTLDRAVEIVSTKLGQQVRGALAEIEREQAAAMRAQQQAQAAAMRDEERRQVAALRDLERSRNESLAAQARLEREILSSLDRHVEARRTLNVLKESENTLARVQLEIEGARASALQGFYREYLRLRKIIRSNPPLISTDGVVRPLARMQRALRRAGTGGAFDTFTNLLALIPLAFRGIATAVDLPIKGLRKLSDAFDTLASKGGAFSKAFQGISNVLGGLATAGGPVTAVIALGLVATAFQVLLALAPAIAGAISGLVGAFTLLGVGVANAAAGLSTIVLLLPGLVAGFAVAITAFQGIGDAIGAFNDYLEETDPKEKAEALDKYNEALGRLSPAAKDAVRALEPFVAAFKDLRVEIQERVFTGLADKIGGLGPAFDVLRDGVLRVADAVSRVLTYAIDQLTSSGTLDDFAASWDIIEQSVEDVGKAIVNFVVGGIALFSGLEAPIDNISGGILGISERFKAWATDEANQGRLSDFLLNAQEALGIVLEIAGEIGEVFGAVFGEGSDDANELLTNIKETFGTIADAVREAAENGDLQQWFEDAIRIAGDFKKALEGAFAIFDALDTPETRQFATVMINGFVAVAQIVAEVTKAIVSGLGIMARSLSAFATAAAAVIEALPGETQVDERLRGAAAALDAFVTDTQAAAEQANATEWFTGVLDDLTNLRTQGLITAETFDFIVSERNTPAFPATMYAELQTLVGQGLLTDQQLAAIVGDRTIPGFPNAMRGELQALVDAGVITDAELQTIVDNRTLPTWPTGLSSALDTAKAKAKVTDDTLTTMSRGRLVNVTVTDGGTVAAVQGKINGLTGKSVTITAKLNSPGMQDQLNASGGLYSRATRAIVGEAGPEAVIPLARPLSQVDPSVRGMAALLRGDQRYAPTTTQGTASKQVNVTMNVYPQESDPASVATSVLNRAVVLARA